jgi:integrase
VVAAIGVVFVRHQGVRTRDVSGTLPSPGASAPTPARAASAKRAATHRLTPEQVLRIIEAVTTMRDAFLVVLLYVTGMRIGEARGLWHEDFQLDENVVWVTPRTLENGARVKSGKPRPIPQFPNKPLNEVEHGRSGGIRGQFGSGYRVDRLPRLFVRTDDESRRGVVQPSRVMRWARWHGEALRS